MKEERDYIQDLAEIRSMMERSSKFLSLSGWAGIMAGIYALLGAWVAHHYLEFRPDAFLYSSPYLHRTVIVATGILISALVTAIYFSRKKAENNGEKAWNLTSRRMLLNMLVPLFSGGLLIAVLVYQGFQGLIAPMTLIFYGLALFNASNFTIKEVKYLGQTQIILGILNCWFIESGLFFWAIGFGAAHLIYGIYMYFRYER
ncbi:hypothetical protein AB2B38_007690 [Balneola sp. MJW-20]|uniref:hypothetical protein n=1 Tax=Gracilimonas aurantiaca TaxID=3234185 RepID=UPI0034668F82